MEFQSENCLVDLLQCLAEMDISFKVLEVFQNAKLINSHDFTMIFFFFFFLLLKRTDIGRHVNRLRKHSSNEVRRLVKLLIRRWKDIVDEWVRLNTAVEETGDAEYSPFQTHLNNFQDNLRDGTNISNGSLSYCGLKQSLEKKKNISPSSKRLREDYLEEHHAKIQRTREVDLQDVGRPKNSVVANGFQAKYC